MVLSSKTLEKLRNLINEETEYRSGPKLVDFFNQLGFTETYDYHGSFPSRWKYTDDKLASINGTPEIDKCIKILFAPINYIGKYQELDQFIADFNQYLIFDKWKVVRSNTEIIITRATEINIDDEKAKENNSRITEENAFISKDFGEISIEKLPIDNSLKPILGNRMSEIALCIERKANLAAIILMGSTLEGILLGIASANAAIFNRAEAAPKEKGTNKVYPFNRWTLSNYIDVACEVNFIQLDVKKFSHILREFRNYIHPYQQMAERFNPTEHTVSICYQVLKAAISQLQTKK